MRVVGAIALFLAACVTEHELHVEVTAPDGGPAAGATVACVCEPSGDAGGITGSGGDVILSVFNSTPESCLVTVAHPDARTRQVEVVDLPASIAVKLEAIE